MRVLDLFSGIGGFSLGLERAGMTTVAFCEINPYCRAVLKKHWPNVPCADDVTKREFVEGEADIITAGFPCQDISWAGDGAGLAGNHSGLFREVIRAVRVVRPAFTVLENVAALLDRGMGAVLGEVASIGLDAEWHCIPASAVGLPHERDRVFVVAYAAREPWLSGVLERGLCPVADRVSDWKAWAREQWPEAESALCRVDDGVPNRSQRVEALGNSVVPQIPEIIGKAIMSTAQ